MKKKYIKPLFRARKVEAVIMTPSSGHHDNGKHNGWNNPNNPHYPYNPDEDQMIFITLIDPQHKALNALLNS